MLEVRGVAAFEDNYIWLAGAPGSREVLVVDPGDADAASEALEAAGLRPLALLITHRHGDHTGGIRELTARYGVEAYGPANESISGLTRRVHDGDRLAFGDLSFEVLETPGHTRGHVCYFGEGALFPGDTLFTGGCGRLFEGTPAQMYASLERIRALPDQTLVYCAHEYTLANLTFARIAEPGNPEIADRFAAVQAARARGEPTVPAPLGLEKRTNPFLRSHVPELRRAAEAWAGRQLLEEYEIFATVRAWKDSLD